EVFERQLAPDTDERTRDRDPASVEPRIERDERAMARWVEDPNDLLTDEDGVWQDDAPAEHRREGLRDRGLPGAGRPEEKDRAPAVDRGTELAKSLLRKDEMVERFTDLVEGDLHAPDGLCANAIDVRGQWDWRRPDVAV